MRLPVGAHRQFDLPGCMFRTIWSGQSFVVCGNRPGIASLSERKERGVLLLTGSRRRAEDNVAMVTLRKPLVRECLDHRPRVGGGNKRRIGLPLVIFEGIAVVTNPAN